MITNGFDYQMEMFTFSCFLKFAIIAASTFDFSDLSSIAGGNADNKASADSDLPIFQGRDRAFSFEVFNFAGGDDLLPNPVSSYSMPQAPSLAPVNVEAPSRRPRGDSIIFDPSSFQDGGIHEKN